MWLIMKKKTKNNNLKTDNVSHLLKFYPFLHNRCTFQEQSFWPPTLFIPYTLYFCLHLQKRWNRKTSIMGGSCLVDFQLRNNTMLKRQLEKHLRSLPAVSHKQTTLGHSSQTTRILWGEHWLVRSLNFILWNFLKSFGHFREIKYRKL